MTLNHPATRELYAKSMETGNSGSKIDFSCTNAQQDWGMNEHGGHHLKGHNGRLRTMKRKEEE